MSNNSHKPPHQIEAEKPFTIGAYFKTYGTTTTTFNERHITATSRSPFHREYHDLSKRHDHDHKRQKKNRNRAKELVSEMLRSGLEWYRYDYKRESRVSLCIKKICKNAVRVLHKIYAKLNGYFWSACPICTKSFGGHQTILDDEWWHTIPSPTGRGYNVCVCPDCGYSLGLRRRQVFSNWVIDEVKLLGNSRLEEIIQNHRNR